VKEGLPVVFNGVVCQSIGLTMRRVALTHDAIVEGAGYSEANPNRATRGLDVFSVESLPNLLIDDAQAENCINEDAGWPRISSKTFSGWCRLGRGGGHSRQEAIVHVADAGVAEEAEAIRPGGERASVRRKKGGNGGSTEQSCSEVVTIHPRRGRDIASRGGPEPVAADLEYEHAGLIRMLQASQNRRSRGRKTRLRPDVSRESRSRLPDDPIREDVIPDPHHDEPVDDWLASCVGASDVARTISERRSAA
jgi:hypothetical protein